ncbi:MAG: putative hydrolase of the superfamily [Thermoanaerobaculia bacterium]|jgi:2-haloacid dehalogenase/putative hydrolase of the HAD superfamily|nr:putative hydrolase of the superfamily [Thermoanaerobaculia bacterium]
MARYDIITFDCYGTLIDWESGIADAFVHAAKKDDVLLRREDILREYANTERHVESEIYRSYHDVLQNTAIRVAFALGWPISDETATFLAESLPSWRPFPDTNPALERLAATGCRLGILSNIDDDLIAATRKHFTVDFDLVITAQQMRSYKPGHAHFLAAKERIGSARWLHAAESNFHDIVPANALGIDTAWINRLHHQPLAGGVPKFALHNLTELADAII